MPHELITCGQCAWYKACGGLHGQMSLHGCFVHCATPGLCAEHTWVCPCQGDVFRTRLQEVGGLHDDRSWATLKTPSFEMPMYVPILRHGKKRKTAFSRAMVGISIRDLLPRRQERTYHPVATTADALRDRFRIARGTPLLVSCVAPDPVIEAYWSFRNVTHVPGLLAELGIAAITTPNFSFFTDAPRTHTLWCRKRIMITAEEFSAAGIAVIPHLNALTPADWSFWEGVLLAQSDVCYVAIEGQTGYRNRRIGAGAIDALSDIQQRLGRPLHPLLIGGAQYARDVAQRFASYTIADSHPFMTAVHRQELVNVGRRARKFHNPRNLDLLLDRNVDVWEDVLRQMTNARTRRSPRLRLAG